MICKQYDLCKKRVFKRVDLTIVKKGEYSADVLSAPGCYARGQGVAEPDETYKILDKTRQTAVVFWQQEDRGDVKMKVSETLEHRFLSSQS